MSCCRRDLSAPEEVHRLAAGIEGGFLDPVWSPDSRLLAVIEQDLAKSTQPRLLLWNVETGERLLEVSPHKGQIYQVAFSPDGSTLASCSADKTVALLDLPSRKLLGTIETSAEGGVRAIAFAPSGERLLTAEAEGSMTEWKLSDRTRLRSWSLRSGQFRPTCAAYSSDGMLFAVGTENKVVVVYDLQLQRVRHLKGHDLRVTSVQFSPDGRRLLSMAGSTAMLWDPSKDSRYAEIGTVRDLLLCVACSPDGRWIAYGGAGVLRDGQTDVILQLAATGEIAHRIPNVPMQHCDFSPDSRFLVVCSASHVDSERHISRRAATLVDVTTGLVQQRIEIPQTRILQARFASSDQLLLGCEDGSVRVWDMPARQEKHSLSVATNPIVSLTPADGGRLLYARSVGAATQVWDLAERKGLQQLGGNAAVLQLAASQDGQYVAIPTPNPLLGPNADQELLKRRARGEAVENLENHVDILDARTQKLLHRLAGHTKNVNCLAFTPDSRRLATGSSDGTIKIWDAATGHELLSLSVGASVGWLAFSPDSQELVCTIPTSNASKVLRWGRSIRSQ